MAKLFFSTIEVTRQAFYNNSLAYAIVNLKPIVPGHVLVIPTRPVARLSQLTPAELSSLMTGVQQVGRVIERAYGADALTIACQDGKAAGQSVPHVHFHLLPRKAQGDFFARNDDIYPAVERAESALPQELQIANEHSRGHETKLPNPSPEPLKVDADDVRKPRTLEEMEKEAQWLKTFFEAEKQFKLEV